MNEPSRENLDFIRTIVADDLAAGRNDGRVVTRFPPEPNGYLHIGHASSVHLNFGIANDFGGICHLRFDDTNPETERAHFVDSITEDVRWLGYEWGENRFFASDYFGQMYDFALHLIREGKAYVESLSEAEIREYRGTVTEPGRPGPYRERSVEENLDLFQRMRAGEFPNGAHVLRAKIDLSSTNMLMRDPVLYRIRHAEHYRTGDDWFIYPLYDWAHPIEDAIEGVTHSICTLEFENNRAVYDWVVANIPLDTQPRQYEFARRNLDYTVMSKRKMLALVEGGHVTGWDDPRMATIAGLRRRGVTPEAIRAFADLVGVGKTENRTDIGKLEFAIRDDLNQHARRVLCVLKPLRVVITTFPEDRVEELDAPYFPHDVPREGSRMVPFSRVIYIDRDDFHEDPPKGYRRLSPGGEVRLRHAYIIRCDEVIRDEAGEIVELRCSHDPDSRGGGRSVKGTIHWVSAEHSLECEVRLYDRLFTVADPEAGGEDFTRFLNPESLVTVRGARIEPSIADDPGDTRYQFERLGFFWRDPVDSREDALVFNRTVTLRDTWAKKSAEGRTMGSGRGGVRASGRKEASGSSRVSGIGSVASVGEKVSSTAPRSAAPVEPERPPVLQDARRRYTDELGIGQKEAEVVTREEASVRFLEAALAAGAPARAAANWMVHEIPRELPDVVWGTLRFDAAALAELLGLLEDGTLSSSAGREVLGEMIASGDTPESIVDRMGLRQISDAGALEAIVDEVLAKNAAKVDEYRSGRTGLLGFFVGQVMRASGGRANPERTSEILKARLS